MVTDKDVVRIAHLADIGIHHEEDLKEFTDQFNTILEYFDILDKVEEGPKGEESSYNIFREDDVTPSLPVGDVVRSAGASEDGFIKAPRVM